jgi:hypothetical protein
VRRRSEELVRSGRVRVKKWGGVVGVGVGEIEENVGKK